jgi:hypothetical protein
MEMENISRGPSPTFGDFVTVRTERSMQDVTVARLQNTRVQTPLSTLFKMYRNVLRESLSVGRQNIPCATLKRRGSSWVISVCLWSNLMLSGDPVLGHVNVDNRAGLHEQLPQEGLIHLEHTIHF